MVEHDPARRVLRRGLWPLAGLGATAAGCSGVALCVVNAPHRWGWLRSVHAGSAGVAIMSAVAGLVVARGGRIGSARSSLVVGAAAVVILGAMFTSGAQLAWTDPGRGDRGIWVAHRVLVGNHLVSRGDLLGALAVHVLSALVAVVALVLLARRAARAVTP
jgi:hypothetical protein